MIRDPTCKSIKVWSLPKVKERNFWKNSQYDGLIVNCLYVPSYLQFVQKPCERLEVFTLLYAPYKILGICKPDNINLILKINR